MDAELADEMVDGRVLARPWTVVLSWFQTGDSGSVLGLPLRLCRNHTAPPTPAAATAPNEPIDSKVIVVNGAGSELGAKLAILPLFEFRLVEVRVIPTSSVTRVSLDTFT